MSLSPLCHRGCPVITRREVWLPVPVPTRHRHGHQYQVSNLGRVRVLNPRTGATRPLATFRHATGYLACSLGRYDKATRTGGCTLVHRLVALAFLGDPPRDGRAWEVDHLDFGRTNAHVTNLRWLPKQVNAWRWKRLEQLEPDDPDMDPALVAELARYDALAAAAGYAV